MEKKKDDWLQSKWRPMMGWVYMTTCITDFILFPIMWSVLQALNGGVVTTQWNPITLQGAGLFHLAMGAVLGVAAWSRGQEKIARVSSNYVPQTGVNYGYEQPYQSYQDYSYARQTPVNTGYIFTSKQGKPGPIIEEPEL